MGGERRGVQRGGGREGARVSRGEVKQRCGGGRGSECNMYTYWSM